MKRQLLKIISEAIENLDKDDVAGHEHWNRFKAIVSSFKDEEDLLKDYEEQGILESFTDKVTRR